MNINLSFDSSVSSAPTGFVATVNAVAQFLQSTFSDNVTINVAVGFGEVAGQTVTSLGASVTQLGSYSYTQIRNALIGDARTSDDQSAVASLPTSSPLGGATYWVPRAQAKALGLLGASTASDGSIGFASTPNIFDYDRSDGIAPGKYDFYGVVAHELTEVMGRQLMAADTFAGHANSLEPMDLFHYAGVGARTFGGTSPGYFSPDGGATNLDNFNTNGAGDFGDWAASAGNDAFLAFGNSGAVASITTADLRVMDVIGWDRVNGATVGVVGDTAYFSSNLVNYTVKDFGQYIAVSGPDGNKTLTNIAHLSFADGVVNVADGAPLFDTAFYDSTYQDVYHAGANALAHYNGSGWHEGRNPNPYFSTSFYLAANFDVRASGANPLTQYDQQGWRDGRDPSPNFDTKLYLIHNPDVAAAGVDPLLHYLQNGMAEGRAAYAAIGTAVNGFDAEYYVMHNPDVAAAGVDPLAHFMNVGWKEGRNPNALFDVNGYLARYADVARAGVNPLVHYEQSGWKEGRDPSAAFDTLHYLAAYADVANAHINPLDHYLNSGIYEGRSTFADGSFH
jgi:hypothetical protein